VMASRFSRPGAFASAAQDMATRGLAVIPLGGEDGKRPLVKGWSRNKRPQGPAFIDKIAAQHPEANIGIVCGLSGVTVVDIDDPAITDEVLARCGETPIKIATPSGGIHLYYRHQGEGSANLPSQGIEADIKGLGGMVAAPPSVRPATGTAYRFIEGSWDDLPRLPPLQHVGLASLARHESEDALTLRQVGVGQRNDTLFHLMLRVVPKCASLDGAITHARAINAGFSPPLPDDEVVGVAAKVWRWELQGDNWVEREARVSVPISMWRRFPAYPDALLLFGHLMVAHAARGTPFAVSPKPMAAHDVIRSWKWRRIASALEWLVQRGFLVRVHQGGKRPGDPSLYEFGPAARQWVR
jgi:bifunctional DNA primase/polymerase-like protein/primase-like protein